MAGQTIAGRYVLEQPLGGGAMGAVWRARDSELERSVAVKLLAPAADRARFEREARAVAGLTHPNICQLFDYGEAEQGPYMILEYLPGGTLEDRLARGTPLPDEQSARIAADVAGALAYAHEHGVVHRDLKPANILFDAEGRAKIADWGIARIAGGEALTKAGTVMGTAAYISPEQGAGAEATPASDVYSFGAILYRMLTGRPPFASDSALELMRLHGEAAPTPIGESRPDAPSELAALAERALEKDPARRPRDGAALAAALGGAATAATMLAGTAPAEATAATAILGDAFAAPPTQVIPRARPGRKRRRTAPLLVAALLALLAAGVAAAILLTQTGTSSAPPPTGSVSLPNVSTAGTSTTVPASTSTTLPETTATPSTTAPATTSTTEGSSSTSTTTTARSTTTAAATTTPATIAPPPPTISTTVSISTDTAATTTVAATTTGP